MYHLAEDNRSVMLTSHLHLIMKRLRMCAMPYFAIRYTLTSSQYIVRIMLDIAHLLQLQIYSSKIIEDT
jgi:hypothetical protein